jgi:hypothetical protein
MVKSSDFLRERVALFTNEASLLYKAVSLCALPKVNPARATPYHLLTIARQNSLYNAALLVPHRSFTWFLPPNLYPSMINARFGAV